MKTLQWTQLFAVCLSAGILGLGFSPAARADVVKLKDGTIIEGTVLEQTATEVVIEKKFAGGSIMMKETIKKTDIAEVVLATPAEKARQEMELAYQATQKYKLDPQRSLAKDYYESVIEGSLRKFLVAYPESPYAKEVADKIMAWEEELGKVAAGQAKVQGDWMDAENAAKLLAQEKTQELLRQAQAFTSASRFAEAIQRYDEVIKLDAAHSAVQIAERSRSECYKRWHDFLQQQQNTLGAEIPRVEARITELREEVKKAQEEIRGVQGSGFKKTTGNTTRMGADTSRFAAANAKLTSSQAELNRLLGRLPSLQAELTELKRVSALVQAKAGESGIQVASATTAASTPGASAPTEQANSASVTPADDTGESDLLGQIAALWKKYWIFLAGGGVLLVWFVSRRLGR